MTVSKRTLWVGACAVVFITCAVLLEMAIFVAGDTVSIATATFAVILPIRICLYLVCLVVIGLSHGRVLTLFMMLSSLVALSTLEIQNPERWQQGRENTEVMLLGFVPIGAFEVGVKPAETGISEGVEFTSDQALVKFWLTWFAQI